MHGDFCFKIDNEKLHNICHTEDVRTFIRKQQKNYVGHVVWMPVDRGIKQLMFNSDKYHRIGRTTPFLLEQVFSDNNLTVERFINSSIVPNFLLIKVWLRSHLLVIVYMVK